MNAKRNILLIDDSEKFAYKVQLILLTNGNTGSVEVATNADRVGEILNKQNTSLIISDIKLAEGNTLALIKRAKKALAHISVIVLTNHFDEFHRLHALKAGADFFIDKAMAFQDIPRILSEIDKKNLLV